MAKPELNKIRGTTCRQGRTDNKSPCDESHNGGGCQRRPLYAVKGDGKPPAMTWSHGILSVWAQAHCLFCVAPRVYFRLWPHSVRPKVFCSRSTGDAFHAYQQPCSASVCELMSYSMAGKRPRAFSARVTRRRVQGRALTPRQSCSATVKRSPLAPARRRSHSGEAPHEFQQVKVEEVYASKTSLGTMQQTPQI